MSNRGRWVWDRELRDMVPAEEFYAKQARNSKRSNLASPQVMRDIQPFINVAVDGKEISSRSQKREMMKEHGLVEVGNEMPRPRKVIKPDRKAVRTSLKRSLQTLGV